jgi:hypothetical protein
MSSSPFKASKITGAGPISAGPSGYFARGSVRSEVSERFVRNGFPPSGVCISNCLAGLILHTWTAVKYY